jgi:hypothetical protein
MRARGLGSVADGQAFDDEQCTEGAGGDAVWSPAAPGISIEYRGSLGQLLSMLQVPTRPRRRSCAAAADRRAGWPV